MKTVNVTMKHTDGRETEVNKESVAEMKELGWTVVPNSEKEAVGNPVISSRNYNEEAKDYQIVHQTPDGKRTVVSGPNASLPPAPPTETKTQVQSNDGLSPEELEAKYSQMTKADIAVLLDARNIKYGPNETKAELIAHLTKGE